MAPATPILETFHRIISKYFLLMKWLYRLVMCPRQWTLFIKFSMIMYELK